jgi:hypothetical protein
MSRVHDYLVLVDDPTQPSFATEPSDQPLFSLLAHLAAQDGAVVGDELALLLRLRPELSREQTAEWTRGLADQPLDWSGLQALAQTEDDRWDLLRLAARMVCLDGDLAESELGVLRELTGRLGLDPSVLQATLEEVVAGGGGVDEAHIRDALRHMWWDRLTPTRDPLESDLSDTVPAGANPICSVLLGEIEVAGLYAEGLAGRFDGGNAFVRWEDIRSYTRVPVPGAAFHLRTNDGEDHAMADAWLGDVGALLDLAHGRKPIQR